MDLTPRQCELADAALGIVAEEGMSAVTFRSVAAASGWSLGAVQKAFATKGDLQTAMLARLRDRSGAVPTSEPGRPTLLVWLTDLAVGILPLDQQRRALTLQGSAFAERAAYDAEIGAVVAAGDREIRGLLVQLVARAQAEGEVERQVVAADVVRAYLALVQGLATQQLYDPLDEAAARTLLRGAVAALLGLPADAGEGVSPASP